MHSESCTILIFGASGDLTKRMLIPSLFHLFVAGLLPENFMIMGLSDAVWSDEDFRREMQLAIGNDESVDKLNQFISHLYYRSGNFESKNTFHDLNIEIKNIEERIHLSGNRIYYLAVPPILIPQIVKGLKETEMNVERDSIWRRIVVEKPFGHDLESSRALNRLLKEAFNETQIYRIDHYLGKETVQNIMVLRFANGIFEPTWNRRYIESVQITVAEEIGIEQRGAYYERAGALRDMVPSHLFQIMELIAMEPPGSFGAEEVRDEYKKVIGSVIPLTQKDVLASTVRGQYQGYRNEAKVDKSSSVETYAAMRLMIDNWRWSGVPFYLRTGKRLKKRLTEVVITFKPAPVKLFSELCAEKIHSNQLVLHLQPNEGISLDIGAKIPGPTMKIQNVNLDFKYKDYFGPQKSSGYETLLYDCIKGDATLFRREDQVDLAWQVVMPILNTWGQSKDINLPVYPVGSDGPPDADALLARDGQKWKPI